MRKGKPKESSQEKVPAFPATRDEATVKKAPPPPASGVGKIGFFSRAAAKAKSSEESKDVSVKQPISNQSDIDNQLATSVAASTNAASAALVHAEAAQLASERAHAACGKCWSVYLAARNLNTVLATAHQSAAKAFSLAEKADVCAQNAERAVQVCWQSWKLTAARQTAEQAASRSELHRDSADLARRKAEGMVFVIVAAEASSRANEHVVSSVLADQRASSSLQPFALVSKLSLAHECAQAAEVFAQQAAQSEKEARMHYETTRRVMMATACFLRAEFVARSALNSAARAYLSAENAHACANRVEKIAKAERERVPKVLKDKLKDEAAALRKKMEKIREKNSTLTAVEHATPYQVNESVLAFYRNVLGVISAQPYSGVVTRVNANGTYTIKFDDGDIVEYCPETLMLTEDGKRKPNQQLPDLMATTKFNSPVTTGVHNRVSIDNVSSTTIMSSFSPRFPPPPPLPLHRKKEQVPLPPLFAVGEVVTAYFKNLLGVVSENPYPAVIVKYKENGIYSIKFNDGDVDENCPEERILTRFKTVKLRTQWGQAEEETPGEQRKARKRRAVVKDKKPEDFLFQPGELVCAYFKNVLGVVGADPYPAVIGKCNSDGTYTIKFEDGDVDRACPEDLILTRDKKTKTKTTAEEHNSIIQKQIVPWKDVALREILYSSVGLDWFERFLQEEFSEENLDFWRGCQEYKSMIEHTKLLARNPLDHEEEIAMHRSKLLDRARTLFSQYIDEKGRKQVNLKAATRNIVRSKLERAHAAPKEHFVDATIFDACCDEITNLMEKDTFARFKKSSLFLSYLAGDVLPPRKAPRSSNRELVWDEDVDEFHVMGVRRKSLTSSTDKKKRPPPLPASTTKENSKSDEKSSVGSTDSPSCSPRNSQSESVSRKYSRSDRQTLLRMTSLSSESSSGSGSGVAASNAYSSFTSKLPPKVEEEAMGEKEQSGDKEEEVNVKKEEHVIKLDPEFEEGLRLRQLALEQEWEREVRALEQKLAEQTAFSLSSPSASSPAASSIIISIRPRHGNSEKRRKPPKPSSPFPEIKLPSPEVVYKKPPPLPPLTPPSSSSSSSSSSSYSTSSPSSSFEKKISDSKSDFRRSETKISTTLEVQRDSNSANNTRRNTPTSPLLEANRSPDTGQDEMKSHAIHSLKHIRVKLSPVFGGAVYTVKCSNTTLVQQLVLDVLEKLRNQDLASALLAQSFPELEVQKAISLETLSLNDSLEVALNAELQATVHVSAMNNLAVWLVPVSTMTKKFVPMSRKRLKTSNVQEGYLLKKASGGLDKWQKRYFKIIGGHLEYHLARPENEDVSPKKIMSLKGSVTALVDDPNLLKALKKDKGQMCVFQLVVHWEYSEESLLSSAQQQLKQRDYLLCAEDEADMIRWINAISFESHRDFVTIKQYSSERKVSHAPLTSIGHRLSAATESAMFPRNPEEEKMLLQRKRIAEAQRRLSTLSTHNNNNNNNNNNSSSDAASLYPSFFSRTPFYAQRKSTATESKDENKSGARNFVRRSYGTLKKLTASPSLSPSTSNLTPSLISNASTTSTNVLPISINSSATTSATSNTTTTLTPLATTASTTLVITTSISSTPSSPLTTTTTITTTTLAVPLVDNNSRPKSSSTLSVPSGLASLRLTADHTIMLENNKLTVGDKVLEVIYSGEMYKKSTLSRHLWQKRLFVLSQQGLFYFVARESSKQLQFRGVITIQSIEKVDVGVQGRGAETGMRLNLTLTGASAADLIAQDQTTCLQWAWHLSKLMETCKQGSSLLAPLDSVPLSLDAQQSAMLSWCRESTAAFGIQINDLSSSWADGRAFCALIANWRPDLIDFDSLLPDHAEENLTLAFLQAQRLGIESLLDPEDVVEYADPRNMMTQLILYHRVLSAMNNATSTPGAGLSPGLSRAVTRLTQSLENIQAQLASLTEEDVVSGRGMKLYYTLQKLRPALVALQPSVDSTHALSLFDRLNVEIPARVNRILEELQIVPDCPKCNQSITGATIEFGAHVYHSVCFVCSVCQTQLEASCLSLNNIAWCDACFTRHKGFLQSQRLGLVKQ